ncbi:sulfate reduction electron transfer complex DsrMKJOP subunit DsrP [Desulfovibrio sp. UCD-KL4C]|uniref:sulfate reduction electron transfer complex DsrMKJOP subunit DsrP n=1 Tax=Desulfovibrio sp. UCD-KL4C TaxID=2578120 RepID=UPI0025C3A0A0|nr:NrfD/PsrC family molybdoenzyme membrane anchor subunit [Desulfovibrio sp. UCD-KL4C]
MLEKALKGGPKYWSWIIFLLLIIGAGFTVYLNQLQEGLTITGMSRDVSWGFYIAQFTYLVGLAASGVMIVLPYYFHHYKKFQGMVIMGEFMAIAAVVMCLGFIIVDIGSPQRMMNMIFHPTPNSILFWDMIVLNGYLLLNVVVGWTCLESERQRVEPPKWVRPLAYTSIIWAFSIHTVTAFLYAGLPGRHYWLSAILAARFLASAFCSGPAILLLVVFVVRKLTKYEPGKGAIGTLTTIITYAMCVNVFFFLLEVFTAFYSNIPAHGHSFAYLFVGSHGHTELVPWMWTAVAFAMISLALLIPPKLRYNQNLLPFSLSILVIATWIDKGLGLLIGGFTPNPFGEITTYWPTGKELMVSIMIYALGALVLTILYKIAVDIKRDLGELTTSD